MGILRVRVALSRRSAVMRWITASARRSSPGQAIIEFCLVLPVILLIALVTVDAGRFVFDYIGIRNAAMEGAIYGSLHPTDPTVFADAEERVQEHFTPTATDLSVDPAIVGNCSPGGQPGLFTVSVSREFSPLSLAALQALGPGADWEFTVNSTATARCMS